MMIEPSREANSCAGLWRTAACRPGMNSRAKSSKSPLKSLSTNAIMSVVGSCLPPLKKGDRGGFVQMIAYKIPPGPPFSKGGTVRLRENRHTRKGTLRSPVAVGFSRLRNTQPGNSFPGDGRGTISHLSSVSKSEMLGISVRGGQRHAAGDDDAS